MAHETALTIQADQAERGELALAPHANLGQRPRGWVVLELMPATARQITPEAIRAMVRGGSVQVYAHRHWTADGESISTLRLGMTEGQHRALEAAMAGALDWSYCPVAPGPDYADERTWVTQVFAAYDTDARGVSYLACVPDGEIGAGMAICAGIAEQPLQLSEDGDCPRCACWVAANVKHVICPGCGQLVHLT